MADNTAQIQQPKKKCPRKWTEGETTSLIDLLEERPCLLKIFEKLYHSREKREQGFEELQSTLHISMIDTKAKIVSLQVQLGREIAKTKATKSRQSLTDSYKSSWIFWERLHFLTPVLNAGKSNDNLTNCHEVENKTAYGIVNVLDQASEDSSADQPCQITGYRKSRKRKWGEEKKDNLFSTCIRALQEPPPKLCAVPKVSPFPMYVKGKLDNLDKRSRTTAEKRITNILFELEMGGEINSQLSSHLPQFQQFLSRTDQDGNVYAQYPVGRQDSGQFVTVYTR